MTLLADTLAAFLALVLLSAAVHKAIDPRRMASAAAALSRTGFGVGSTLAAAAAMIELMAALALLFPATRIVGALLAAGLWTTYALALAMALRRSETFDCGCTLFAQSRAPGRFAPPRALALALLALAAIAVPAGSWSPDAVFAAVALFSLYVAAGELAALPYLGERKRA